MNHVREIIENTISVKSKTKVLKIIRNQIMNQPDASENEIFKYLKHNPTEEWLKVLSHLTKKDIFIPHSNAFDFFDKKTVLSMLENKLLEQNYLANLYFIKQKNFIKLSKNANDLYNAFEKENYFNINHKNGEHLKNNAVKHHEISFLITELKDYGKTFDKMESEINSDYCLWHYLNKFDDLSLIENKEYKNKSVIERLIDLKKFKLADEETLIFLFDDNDHINHLSNEYKLRLFKQFSISARERAVLLNEDFSEIFLLVKAEEEKKQISKALKTQKINADTVKKRL